MATSDPSSAAGGSPAGTGDLFASLFADLPIRVGLLLRPKAHALEAVTAMAGLEPDQRRYLDLEEITARYGATAESVAAVRAFAGRHDLKVVSASRAGRLVVLQGPGDRVRQAFEADMEAVPHGSGHRHRPRSAVLVPSELRPSVEQVFGLDTLPCLSRGSGSKETLAKPDAASTGQRPGLSPLDVAGRYRFPTSHRGAGQTLAVLVLGGGFYEDDLRQFFGERMPRIRIVEVAGAKNDPAPKPAIEQFLDELAAKKSLTATGEALSQLWWTLETTADIQLAGSFAPEADLVLYFAPNTTLGKLEAITAVITDQQHNPDVLSCSWGAREAELDESFVRAADGYFQLGALRGLSICYSSGDKGADIVDGKPSAHFPATSPHVLACGGTTLDTDVPEYAWDESSGSFVMASGGGFSRFFHRPTWQKGVPDGPGGGARRGVPDASGKADYLEGYELVLAGQSIRCGGTSSAAPMWAGLVTRLGEALKTRVGWLSPLLYARPSMLNLVAPGLDDPAKAGWNQATGLGSPDGQALLRQLEKG